MKAGIIIGLTMVLFFLSCGVKQTATGNMQPDLLSGEWTLTQWKGYDDLSKAFPTGVPVFQLDSEEGTIKGFNGCNQISGQVRYNRERAFLQFFGLSSTKMFCTSVPENELSNTLSRINVYRVTNEELQLLQNDEIMMVFKRVQY
jgi:heat shock protein HslJ